MVLENQLFAPALKPACRVGWNKRGAITFIICKIQPSFACKRRACPDLSGGAGG